MVENLHPENVLKLEIIPNSKKFIVMGFNPWTNSLRVKVKAKPLKQEANKEIEKEFTKLFSARAEIISGKKNKNKKIFIKGISEPEIIKIIQKNQNLIL